MPADGNHSSDLSEGVGAVSRRRLLSIVASSALGVGIGSVTACGRTSPKRNRPTTAPAPRPASSDTEELRELFHHARAQGAIAQLEPGRTYVLTDALDITGVKINGRGATVKWGGSRPTWPAVALLQSAGSANVSSLSIDFEHRASGAQPLAGIACSIEGNDRFWIRLQGISVRNATGPGIRVAGNAVVPTGNSVGAVARISSTRISNCRYGVQIMGIAGIRIENALISNCSANGINAKLCSNLTVISNRIDSCKGHGILILYSDNCVVQGNSSSNNAGGGITLGGGDPHLRVTRGVNVAGNTVIQNGLNGISVDVTQNGRPGVPLPVDAVVQRNTCVRNRKAGINVTCSSDVKLLGNRCASNDNGITLSTRDTTVRGNLCNKNRAWGVAMFSDGKTGLYGGHRVGPNNVSGNGRGSYFVAAGLAGRVQFSKR